MGGNEPLIPHNRALLTGALKEATAAGRGGCTGGGSDRVPRIWKNTVNGDAIQIPCTPAHCDGQLLSRSHSQPTEGVE